MIIVLSAQSVSLTYDLLESKNLQLRLCHQGQANVIQTFFSIAFIHLAGGQLSPLARHQRLKDALLRQSDDAHDVRFHQYSQFSATHIGGFFRLAVEHTVKTFTQPFDFIEASRKGNEVSEELADHLLNLLQLGLKSNVLYEDLASFIASAILLDSYPPGMHRKPRERLAC